MIQRPGQYHITLAPQLNQAQSFIESIAKRFAELHSAARRFAHAVFRSARSQGVCEGRELLFAGSRIARRDLYFQAVNPNCSKKRTATTRTLHEFSEAVLQNHPLSGSEDEQGAEKLCGAVEAVAAS